MDPVSPLLHATQTTQRAPQGRNIKQISSIDATQTKRTQSIESIRLACTPAITPLRGTFWVLVSVLTVVGLACGLPVTAPALPPILPPHHFYLFLFSSFTCSLFGNAAEFEMESEQRKTYLLRPWSLFISRRVEQITVVLSIQVPMKASPRLILPYV